MKILTAFSGGKDSTATLIYTVEKYGAQNVTAVFCDTGWENPITYLYIIEITEQLGVELKVLQSKKYRDMLDLARKKGRFPSTKARFCTEELKVKPMIDYLLDDVNDNFLLFQGIRSSESHSRSLMDESCTYFRYYFEPRFTNTTRLNDAIRRRDNLWRKNIDAPDKLINEIEDLAMKVAAGVEDEKYDTYRKKDVIAFRKEYADDLHRPFFHASANEVIDYHFEHGIEPNPLYKMGRTRVGCDPCIMESHSGIYQMMQFTPWVLDRLAMFEDQLQSTFFAPDKIPMAFRDMETVNAEGDVVQCTTIRGITKYLEKKNATGNLFEQPLEDDEYEGKGCMSYYNICE